MPRRQLYLVALAMAVSCVLFALPVFNSLTDTDPLYHQFTDHIRHRYCASIALTRPIHALTTPLYQLNQSHLSKDPATTFPKDPCGQAGVVHVLFQAPFQWLIDHAGWEGFQATHWQVVVGLLLAHLWLFAMLTSREHAWTAAFVFPFAIRTALMGVQAPLEALLGYSSFVLWMRGRRVLALAMFVATFAAYNRFLIWIPAWMVLILLQEREFVDELRGYASRWSGRALLAAMVASFCWSIYTTILVWQRRHVPPTDRLWHGVCGGVFALVWLIYWWRNRKSELAIFCAVFGLFIAGYNAFIETWYFVPVMVLAPLTRSNKERLLWALSVGFLSDLILWDNGLWSVKYPLHFALDPWLKLLR